MNKVQTILYIEKLRVLPYRYFNQFELPAKLVSQALIPTLLGRILDWFTAMSKVPRDNENAAIRDLLGVKCLGKYENAVHNLVRRRQSRDVP